MPLRRWAKVEVGGNVNWELKWIGDHPPQYHSMGGMRMDVPGVSCVIGTWVYSSPPSSFVVAVVVAVSLLCF